MVGFNDIRVKERRLYLKASFSNLLHAADAGSALKLSTVRIAHFQVQTGDGGIVQDDLKQSGKVHISLAGRNSADHIPVFVIGAGNDDMVLEMGGYGIRSHIAGCLLRLLPCHHGVAEIVVKANPGTVDLLDHIDQLFGRLILVVLQADLDAALLKLRNDLAERLCRIIDYGGVKVQTDLS